MQSRGNRGIPIPLTHPLPIEGNNPARPASERKANPLRVMVWSSDQGSPREGEVVNASSVSAEKKLLSARTKKREREKNEMIKSQLLGLVKWLSEGLPQEAIQRNRSNRTRELFPKPSYRRTIEPLVSCSVLFFGKNLKPRKELQSALKHMAKPAQMLTSGCRAPARR